MNRHAIAAALLLVTLGLVAARPSLEGLEARVDALGNVYESPRTVTLESDPVLEQSVRWDAFCQVGDQAIGGGFTLPANSFDHHVSESRRGTDSRVWSTTIVVAPGTSTLQGTVYAYCLDLTP